MSEVSGVNNAAQQGAERIKASPYSAPTDKQTDVNEEIQNTRLGSRPEQANSPWWYSQFNLMLVVFGLLGVAVLMFITLTPSPVATTVESQRQSDPASNTQANIDEASPWNEARRAQARTDAQEILSNLLDSKKFLEQKEVQNWASTEFDLALLEAEQGDELYQLQDYQQALTIYQSAVDKLDALYKKIPVYVESKIAQGQQAILEGKSQLAKDAFSQALSIEPNNFAAMNGLSRANALDQVLQLSQAAKAEQQLFIEQDNLELLQSAQQKLDEALSLDGQNADVKSLLDEIVVLRQDKQYRDAMTKGFAALFANNYSAANNAFSAALKINPDDNTASLAYQQSLAANKTSSLQSLLNSAKQFESDEDWQNARSNYQAVLSRDANQVQAKLGEIRSNARYQLDAQIRMTLDDPLELSKTAQKQSAQKLLSEAQAIRSAGPKLSSQITQLKNALAQIDATVKVQIISDAITDITLTKEGASQIKLGRFSNKNLALKPGRYVLTGVRFGFRDVRKEIDLEPGNTSLQQFELRCDQPISMNLQENDNDPA